MLSRGFLKFDTGSSGVLAAGRFLETRAIAWGTLLFAITLAFFFASVFGAAWLRLRGDWAYLPSIALPLLACWIYAVLVRRYEWRPPQELKVNLSLFPQISVGFLFGGIFITAMWALLWSLKLYTAHPGLWTHWFDDLIFDSYISAVLEELAFRAIVLRIFARLWGAPKAVLLSSLIFGLAHFTHGSWLGILGIVLNGGVTMGLLYVITGRLWMSIGMHLGYDFVETSVLGIGSHHGLLLNVPKVGAVSWLTGGTFGPDAALPAIALGLALNVVLWQFAFRGNRVSLSRLDLFTSQPTDVAADVG